MPRLLNARLPSGSLATVDFDHGCFVGFHPQSHLISATSSPDQFDFEGDDLLPAAVDMHVHSRDPGLTHKETWAGLARAALRGGVGWVGDMPNTVPPVTQRADVLAKAALAQASGLNFGLYLAVVDQNLEALPAILRDANLPVCGLKVFYGATTGHLVFSRLDRLSRALERVGSSPLVVFHAEDQAIMDAAEARYQAEWERARCCPVGSDAWLESFALHSLRRPPEAAVKAVEEILRWARGWGGRVHIAHVSTAREVELIGEARTLGVRVTCEVAPHHLLLSMEDSPRLGAFLKVNPPVRDRAERERLRRLVGEGVVDAFATDHAPHTREEKSQDLARVPSGIPSLELFWPLVTECARVSGLPWERAVAMASEVPARILGLTRRGLLEVGARADFVRFRREAFRVTQKEIVSSCGYSPYDGMELPGKVREVWIEGRSVSREMARD